MKTYIEYMKEDGMPEEKIRKTDQDLKDMMGVVAITPTGIISYTKGGKNEKS